MADENQSVPWRRYVAEFVGTFFVVFAAAGSLVMVAYMGASSSYLLPALAQGAVVAAMIGATLHVSGGHLNPAVTLGALVAGCIDSRDATGYVVAQFSAAFIASVFVGALFPTEAVEAVQLGQPLLITGVDSSTAFGLEGLLTAMIVFVWFGSVVGRNPTETRVGANGVSVGLATFAALVFALPFTRGAFNPARAIGPAMVGGTLDNAWIFFLAPLVGGVLAGTCYRMLWLRD